MGGEINPPPNNRGHESQRAAACRKRSRVVPPRPPPAAGTVSPMTGHATIAGRHRPQEELLPDDQPPGSSAAQLICYAVAQKRAYSRTRFGYFRQTEVPSYRANAGIFCAMLRLRAWGDAATAAWTLANHSAGRLAVADRLGGAGSLPARMARRRIRIVTPRRCAASGKPSVVVSLISSDPD